VSTLFCSTSSAAWYWSCIFCTHTGGRFSYIVAPQQHSQAASLACVTTAAFTSSLIGMCHHSSIHKQPHWYVSPQHHSQAASLVCVTTAAFTSSLIGMCHHSSTQRLTLSPESCCRGELLAWPRVGGGGAGGSGGDRFKSPTGMCWAWPAVSALRASSCLIFSLQVCIRMRAYSNMWVSKALRAT
jgi:hypothetical protein